ncbi:MAG: amino acid permease [Phycisphaerales bacterium]|jgi:amino acid transporter/nucleotide-binding universal stress UspA family protein|nr:amino acid permease [Phycisphaerales bacterium]MDP7086177.1 amino acid permease [Phycisphaerales bacterium]MDP7519902.1 amino acid permease [Phycisphaerales bacterium]
MADTAAPTQQHHEPVTELARDLRLFDVTMVGVGAMIGAGIFALTGIAAGKAGPGLILAFCLNGVLTLCTAMVYAEVGSAVPAAGGGYLWARLGLPGPAAFLTGWMDWLAHAVAGSLYAVVFGAYVVWGAQTILGLGEPPSGAGHGEGMGTLFGMPAWPIAKGLTLAVCLLFLWINHRGSSETGKAGNIITVSKIIVIGIFIVAGLFAMVGSGEEVVGQKFTPFLPEGFSGVLVAMGLTFIAFEGYEIIVQAGEEVVEPRKNIPKAVFLSLLIVIPIYILVAIVCLGALVIPPDVMAATEWSAGETWRYLAGLGETGVAVAANTFLPWGLGAILLVIGAVLSTMSALNATTFSSTRVSFAMGRDRFLPAALSHVSPKTRTPTIALAASGVLIVSVAILLDAEMVASATCAMFLLVFAMVNISSIVIRRKYGDKLHYGYLVPGGPVIPIVAAIGQVVLVIWLLSSQPLMLWLTVGWVAIGLGIYYSWSRSQEHAFRASPVIYEQTPHVLTSTHQVLVPVANPATAGSLVELAARLTDPTDTAVTVLNVVKVPEQLPFGSTEPFVKEGRVVVEKAMAITETMGREVAGLVRVSRHPGQAIVETVAERKIDTLVMGWTGPKRRPRRMRTIVIGEQIDTVIRRADCDTVILRGSVPSEPKRIVVPVAHPKQGRFAIGIAAHLAGPSTIIEAVRVVASPNDKKSAEKRLHVDLFGEDGSPDLPGVEWPVELTIVVASDITDALVEAGDRADILILGASMGGWRGSMFSPIQYGVAERWQGPLLLVRMRSGAAKFAAHRTIDFLVSTEPEA